MEYASQKHGTNRRIMRVSNSKSPLPPGMIPSGGSQPKTKNHTPCELQKQEHYKIKYARGGP